MRRIKHHELGVLAIGVVLVLALGVVVARDLRRTVRDASDVHLAYARGLEFIDALQFNMQETRRVLLYALSTADANSQLEYVEQSRAIDTDIQRLFGGRAALSSQPDALGHVNTVETSWQRYLVVRNEVIGLILEGSVREAVALDEHDGFERFRDVRTAIRELKDTFTAGADTELRAVRTRTDQATIRLTMLVLSSLVGSAIGFYLVNRRASLEALLRSEAHKGSILQAVPDPIISTDSHGRVIELNDAAQRTFGVSRSDAMGASVDGLVLRGAEPGNLLPALMSINDATPTSLTAPATRLETVGTRPDGSLFPMELAAVTHRVGSDLVFTIHASDMTERLRSEEELRHAKDVAEQAAQGQRDFLATMSHEVRTPLNGVIGIADLLQQAQLPPAQRDLVAVLRASATALMDLVGDVLDYSRIEQGLVELAADDFILRDCLEETIATLSQPAARKGLDVGYLCDPDVPVIVRADKRRVRQVLLNLLSNAVKFTSAGEVSLHVSSRRIAGQDVAIEITVRDSGPGIPEPFRDKLFRRFSQADLTLTGQHAGAGLGLAISKGLCELLNGSLELVSAESDGAVFRFSFQATVIKDAAPRSGSTLPDVQVLAFVADGIIGQQVQALLSEWGISCTLATSDSVMTQKSAPWQAMIVDGDADGGRLSRLAAEYRSMHGFGRLPLIVITHAAAAAGTGDERHVRAVAKPITAVRLRDAVLWAVGAVAIDPAAPVTPPSIVPFEPGALSILVAEDNDANRRVLLMMLEELGLTADVVVNGAEAVAKATTRNYDVILMDVRMPVLDGVEAIAQIRAHASSPRPAIFALTANVMPGEEAVCVEAGMDGYLTKPLRLETLATILRRVVSKMRPA